jgi:hypothetical protein
MWKGNTRNLYSEDNIMIIIVNPEKIEDITLPENEDKCEYNL